MSLRKDKSSEKNKAFMRLALELASQNKGLTGLNQSCLLYTSPSPRDRTRSRMPSSA